MHWSDPDGINHEGEEDKCLVFQPQKLRATLSPQFVTFKSHSSNTPQRYLPSNPIQPNQPTQRIQLNRYSEPFPIFTKKNHEASPFLQPINLPTNPLDITVGHLREYWGVSVNGNKAAPCGSAAWHPGPKAHAIRGMVLAHAYLKAFDEALRKVVNHVSSQQVMMVQKKACLFIDFFFRIITVIVSYSTLQTPSFSIFSNLITRLFQLATTCTFIDLEPGWNVQDWRSGSSLQCQSHARQPTKRG
jgi:hypothetical protein